MLKWLSIIAAGGIVAVAAVLGYAATRPDSFEVRRSIAIDAPADEIFVLVNDLRRWAAWSPYERKDPAMRRDFGAVTAGEGAVYAWEGDGSVGKGRMEITDSSPPSRVAIRLDFEKPFDAHNTVKFLLEPNGESTNVTWAMHGPNLFISKVMGIFINMDEMIGTDFEVGLANLKAVAEN